MRGGECLVMSEWWRVCGDERLVVCVCHDDTQINVLNMSNTVCFDDVFLDTNP